MTVKQQAKQVAHGNRAMKIGSYRSSPILKRKYISRVYISRVICHIFIFILLVQSKNMLILFTSLYKYSFDQYDQSSSQKGGREIRIHLKSRSN